MDLQDILSLMKVEAFQESAPLMVHQRSSIPDNPSLHDVSKPFEVMKYVSILPHFRHLPNKQFDFNMRLIFGGGPPQNSLLAHGLRRVLMGPHQILPIHLVHRKSPEPAQRANFIANVCFLEVHIQPPKGP